MGIYNISILELIAAIIIGSITLPIRILYLLLLALLLFPLDELKAVVAELVPDVVAPLPAALLPDTTVLDGVTSFAIPAKSHADDADAWLT
jgi:hypothetical protein